jgi:hypothetical protein
MKERITGATDRRRTDGRLALRPAETKNGPNGPFFWGCPGGERRDSPTRAGAADSLASESLRIPAQAEPSACFAPETKMPAGAGIEYWRREGDSNPR